MLDNHVKNICLNQMDKKLMSWKRLVHCSKDS
jgi:hypothetical protein